MILIRTPLIHITQSHTATVPTHSPIFGHLCLTFRPVHHALAHISAWLRFNPFVIVFFDRLTNLCFSLVDFKITTDSHRYLSFFILEVFVAYWRCDSFGDVTFTLDIKNCCTASTSFANVIGLVNFPFGYSLLLDSLQIVVHSVLASRILFNLRKSDAHVHNIDTSLSMLAALSTVRFQSATLGEREEPEGSSGL
ncbi:hypothetical protein SERLA73DRAFT_189217 [Serpula lacrymans var. lacrymans S7.3]|uniref:Uncharacterized protein n=2 Tax=Serpula lacrymans var. lacrymans TaxID=341189 RepID=F8QD48_SERL3|nr:uncharacterized protein SERLADRAFT_453859 [Serpula lacrymans var. lacrymans S7.9]EGN93519.1 hypothetical protein SERLA73DRAFT_189217 [Serpula lacrymans var. lacrymans S7.3]EGO18898.1 hypothetical protein SERLADRAFT_453859 [Serpula lacrymans var. lacrymans S7.9]